ncbi:MAG: RloB family protein [Flavipsychrobacter sp.]
MANRQYKKGLPFRDATLYIIACEGEKREKEYFEYIASLSQRIKIKILFENQDKGKSAPKWLLDRATSYCEDIGLNSSDELWLVMDVDRWSRDVFRQIEQACKDNHWNIAISNPCFEVWLYAHLSNPDECTGTTCKQIKRELDNLQKGGYKVDVFIHKIKDAIQNCKNNDNHATHFMPEPKGSKMYKLAEKLIKVIDSK